MLLFVIMVGSLVSTVALFLMVLNREFAVYKCEDERRVIFREEGDAKAKFLSVEKVLACFLLFVLALMFVGYEMSVYDSGITREAWGDVNLFNAGRATTLEEIDRIVENVDRYNSLVYRGKERVGTFYDGIFTRKFANLDYLELNQELLSKVVSKDYLVS